MNALCCYAGMASHHAPWFRPKVIAIIAIISLTSNNNDNNSNNSKNNDNSKKISSGMGTIYSSIYTLYRLS